MNNQVKKTVLQKADESYDIREEVLKDRYLAKDKNGNIVEDEMQMFRRVAEAVTSVEGRHRADANIVREMTDAFYQLMVSSKFLPNSPTLMNAGRPEGLLSACFVLPIEDSVNGIFETIKNTALIQKAGGGTGFTFDNLRPTGDIVSSSAGKTSGPISFWRVLSETTNAIQQGAHRRGANMGMMSIEHPDIIKFINAKKDPAAFNNFNISVKVTNEFMTSLQKNPDSLLVVTNPRTGEKFVIPRSINFMSYRLQDLSPVSKATDDCYTVGDIWQMLVHNAHKTGEPGICFIDRINKDNPTPHVGTINATNPCGEQPLLDYESCNLGSVNIAKFVLHDESGIDWQNLAHAIKLAVRFLDDVIDANYYPIPQIEQITLANRKIGLGVMGFADTLILLGIRYNSNEAVSFAQQISEFIQNQAYDASTQLAEERGCFPNWSGSLWDTQHHRHMRNASCTTIAPTGTISIIADCSSGIEPIYKLAYKRLALDGRPFVQTHPLVEKIGNEMGWLTDSIKNELLSGTASHDISEIPKQLADLLITAHEVSPEWHVRIQAAFQQNTHNAVSKTVNLPENGTADEVDKVFRLAYSLGCKGVTVYRDNSRQHQVLSVLGKDKAVTQPSSQPRTRPRVTAGQTSKFRMGCGTLFVTANKDENGLCEVFANLGKAGGCPAQSEATCRVVSAALRSGVSPEVLIDQLRGIRCLSAAVARKSNNGDPVVSCPDAIARALKEALDGDIKAEDFANVRICEKCGQPMRKEANCAVCDACGITTCG